MEFFYLKSCLFFLLLICSTLFSGSEAAFFSLTRYQILKLKETPRGKQVASLVDRPNRLLVSITIGNDTVNIIASALATSVCLSFFGENGKWLAIAIMTPLLLLVGDIIPKTIAYTNASNFSIKVAPFIKFFIYIATPLRYVIKYIINFILFFMPPPAKKSYFLENHFLDLIETGHKKGELKHIEKEFITQFIRFRQKTISEVMVPRPDIFALSVDMYLEKALTMLKYHRFSKIPIYEGNLDNIIGILRTKQLLEAKKTQKLRDIKQWFLSPYFVPETKRAEALFWQLQKEKITMAIIVNEYGSIVGLLTIEDLLEELFGEIYDEYDVTQRWYHQIAPNKYKVLAKMPLSDFNFIFKTDLVSEEDTLGGLILSVLGRLPKKGESTQIANLKFTVKGLKGRRITELEVEKINS
jgi:CBS domain containing-hemolysin-like protein